MNIRILILSLSVSLFALDRSPFFASAEAQQPPAVSSPGLSQSNGSKPNIVFIIADDLGANDTSFMGHPEARTPALDRLSSKSGLLERMYVASPSCAPSRAAMLTGLMPFRNGAERNHTYPRDDVKQLPLYIKELGYEVVALGKVMHGADERAGFDYVDREMSIEDVVIVEEYLSQRQSDQPLLLFIGIKDPHVPWPEEPFAHYDSQKLKLPVQLIDTPDTRLEYARYLTDVERMDMQIGTALDAVEKHLGEDVITFFTSDHGAQLPYGKWNNYEISVKAPMLISWPGVVEPGQRFEAMASFVDILPTLIEIAGCRPPASGYGENQIDGRSLVPLFKGETDTHRDYVFSTNASAAHHTYPLRSVCSERYRYIRNVYPELNFTSQTDHNPKAESHNLWVSWVEAAKGNPEIYEKLMGYHQRPAEELYDLHADPDEQINLAGDPKHVQTLRKLRAITDNWIRLSGDTLQMRGPPMDILIPVEE